MSCLEPRSLRPAQPLSINGGNTGSTRSCSEQERVPFRPVGCDRLMRLFSGWSYRSADVVYLAIVLVTGSAPFSLPITIAIYIFAYTPLKRISTTNTAGRRGARSDPADDRLGGCARSSRRRSMEPVCDYVLWQMPHFFAIAWMYREDYARAGFRMIIE